VKIKPEAIAKAFRHIAAMRDWSQVIEIAQQAVADKDEPDGIFEASTEAFTNPKLEGILVRMAENKEDTIESKINKAMLLGITIGLITPVETEEEA
jgi:hypothetical protein